MFSALSAHFDEIDMVGSLLFLVYFDTISDGLITFACFFEDKLKANFESSAIMLVTWSPQLNRVSRSQV
jgi:hypothetical protein